nr:hypothetical protein [Bradyrhizobium sp. CCH5-A9]
MSTEAATAAPAEKPVARIVTKVPREKIIPLEFEVEFGGQVYSDIRVRRLSGAEVALYYEQVQAGYRSARPPTVDCPDEVYDALDDDDRYTVEAAAIDFLPRRLREGIDALTSESTAESSPSSQAS